MGTCHAILLLIIRQLHRLRYQCFVLVFVFSCHGWFGRLGHHRVVVIFRLLARVLRDQMLVQYSTVLCRYPLRVAPVRHIVALQVFVVDGVNDVGVSTVTVV